LIEDLRVIKACGFRVVPLQAIVDAAMGTGPALRGKYVALTFDDAPDIDYVDIVRPDRGLIKSMARILRESGPQRTGIFRRPTFPSALSFVIASPAARQVLDSACIAGLGEWNDTWWREAHRNGPLQIGNHSWDHTHDALPEVAQRDQKKGTFSGIDSYEDADAQIRAAEDYIEGVLGGPSARLFAYPYGPAVEYLYREYFPNFQHEHRQTAAFTTDGDYVAPGADRWRLPRFVCGFHWKTPEDLAQILTKATA
jgi:peptidoglycan/xylan/chitin deacetylase (PgdA/CDA1 family)